MNELPLLDTLDMEILMHRDAHFSGNFDVMIEYYSQDGVGVMPDFEVEEIEKLKRIELEGGEDLAAATLPEGAREQVAKAKKLYAALKEAYEGDAKDTIGRCISDLILSEEESPEKEITAVVTHGGDAVPALVHLLGATSYYDPLYPGYGRSPIFAATCLAKIGDDRAIAPLFEALGNDNFFTDEEILKALASFGEKGKSFLLGVLKQTPYARDNERAALALSSFEEDPEIALEALRLLEDENLKGHPTFASYLIFCAEGLEDSEKRKRFIHLSTEAALPKELKSEMDVIIRAWG